MRLIGPYSVAGFLGRGGAAKVFLVRPPGGGLAALKLFRPREPLEALVGQDTLLAWFRQETADLARLSHSNLVRVLDQGLHQGAPYYVMEHFCASLAGLLGEDLDPSQTCRALHPEQCLDIAGQALAGLAALHGAGLVHRDLSPFNLMLDDQGQVKITDLGFAGRQLCGQALPANLMLGTPYFSAPEQEGDPGRAGPPADLYSLGVIFKRMLSGRLHTGGPPGLERDAPFLGPTWGGFLARLLASDPKQRPADAGQAAGELADLKAAWERERETVCAHPAFLPRTAREEPTVAPRSTGGLVRLDEARQAWGLDRLWRPLVHVGGFRPGPGPGEVRQEKTGLVWQQEGSPGPLGLQEAVKYVEKLNRPRPAATPWRLPTMPELLGLAGPLPTEGGLCLAGPFGSSQARLWSTDRATACHHWRLNLAGGFAERCQSQCRNWARAVRAPA